MQGPTLYPAWAARNLRICIRANSHEQPTNGPRSDCKTSLLRSANGVATRALVTKHPTTMVAGVIMTTVRCGTTSYGRHGHTKEMPSHWYVGTSSEIPSISFLLRCREVAESFCHLWGATSGQYHSATSGRCGKNEIDGFSLAHASRTCSPHCAAAANGDDAVGKKVQRAVPVVWRSATPAMAATTAATATTRVPDRMQRTARSLNTSSLTSGVPPARSPVDALGTPADTPS